MKLSKKIPDDGAIKEALMHHNGWVYEIDPGFNREDEIPPQSIVGAWKVDENGKIIGEFVPNPNYVNLKDYL